MIMLDTFASAWTSPEMSPSVSNMVKLMTGVKEITTGPLTLEFPKWMWARVMLVRPDSASGDAREGVRGDGDAVLWHMTELCTACEKRKISERGEG